MCQSKGTCRSAASIGLCFLLCVAVVIGSVVIAPPVAKASGTETLIKDWTKKYGGSDLWTVTKSDSPADIVKLKKAGKNYRVVPQKGHIEQTIALKNAVDKILSQYGITASMLNAYYPSFTFWADKNDKPFWRIHFKVKQDKHLHKPITVDVNATDGSIRYISRDGG